MLHRIGIIGGGGIGGTHAAILAKDSRVTLQSIFDIDAARAQAMAANFGCQHSKSIDELLKQSDAVFVCTPNTTHEEVATQALQAGKHVF